MKSNYIVMFLRFLTSACLQANAELYSCYLEEGKTIEQFRRTEVEPLDIDADNVKIIDVDSNHGSIQLHGHPNSNNIPRQYLLRQNNRLDLAGRRARVKHLAIASIQAGSL